MLSLVLLLLLTIGSSHGQKYLAVSGKDILLNGEKVFLSGMNIAWYDFGKDFGEGRYECCTGKPLEDYLRRISESGANSVRIWIHCDARLTPMFDKDGFVTASDSVGSMTGDLSRFLDKARSYNILVFITLWTGAGTPRPQLEGLLYDDRKLSSYINKVLRPLVRALKDKQALGGWDIMNEPEGIVRPNVYNDNPCFDTNIMRGTGGGWTKANIPIYRILRFINRQIAAIKEEDGKALATVGAAAEKSMSKTGEFEYRNYYTDRCLIEAGGMFSGTVDFYQMHTYARGAPKVYKSNSVMLNHNNKYQLDKPNVIGEFSQSGGDGRDITSLMDHAYYYGYSGGWTWQANGGGNNADDFKTQARGMRWLMDRNDQSKGGKVNISFL